MTFVSAGHIILTPTQPVGSGRPQRGSSPGPPHQEPCALPTELSTDITGRSKIIHTMAPDNKVSRHRHFKDNVIFISLNYILYTFVIAKAFFNSIFFGMGKLSNCAIRIKNDIHTKQNEFLESFAYFIEESLLLNFQALPAIGLSFTLM